MKKTILLIIMNLCVLGLFAQTCNTTTPNYTTINSACTSGNFTTSSEWIGGTNPPFTLSGGAYTIPAGVVVDIASSTFSLNYDLVVYGTLLVDGKLDMTNTSNKIIVMSGGLVTCCSSGYCGSSCASCGANDKIAIGGSNVYCGTGGCGSVNGSFTGPAVLSIVGLPITLISFDVKVDDGKVDLNWSTATELNFDYFLLQRSSDGVKFDSIGFVKGHGTTNVKQNYKAVDETPFIGKNYYRLTSVDFDKKTETFAIKYVLFGGEKNITLSPNPFNGQQITLNTNFEFSGTINVYDNLGLLVYSENTNGGVINFTSPLRTGIYVVKLTSTDFSKSIRLIVN